MDTSSPQACAKQFGGGYDVEITEPKDRITPSMIRIRKAGREIVALPAHSGSVFARGGEVLYYAEFSRYSQGCRIVAYHLRQGELWKTPLWGVATMGHSMYENRVNMKLDGNQLIVYGDESAGHYIELVDIRTGRIVGKRGGTGKRLFR